jgi:hypothetical protein
MIRGYMFSWNISNKTRFKSTDVFKVIMSIHTYIYYKRTRHIKSIILLKAYIHNLDRAHL